MKLILNRVLPVALALTATAFVAAPASAVEVTDESSSAHCSVVSLSGHQVSGGCPISATSDAQIEFRSLFGTMVLCDQDFEARVDETGQGYIYNQSFTNCSTTVEPCKEPDGESTPWRIGIAVSTDGESFTIEVTLCVTIPIIGRLECHFKKTMRIRSHDVIELEAASGTGSHLFCEGSSTNAVLGNWTAVSDVSHAGVEIVE